MTAVLEKNAHPDRRRGPRSEATRASLATRPVTHGTFAHTPVLPHLEDPAEWDAHRTALLDDFAPQTAYETALAERAILLLWRLRRLARYDTQATLTALPAAQDALTAARHDLATAQDLLHLFETFPHLPDDAPSPPSTPSRSSCPPSNWPASTRNSMAPRRR